MATAPPRWLLLCALLLQTALCACGDDGPAPPPDAAAAEETAAACQDSVDNDGDGKTDCADSGCAAFVFCQRKDAGGDTSSDSAADMTANDSSADATTGDSGADAATDAGAPCKIHNDCQQKAFCHKGACVLDPKLPVYHCEKAGCPPGQWCVAKTGSIDTCPASTTYTCATACDCGPAHCCVGGVCVFDGQDPLKGKPGNKPSCKVGPYVPQAQRVPTYCATDPQCHAGALAWASSGRQGTFLAYNPATKKAQAHCGGDPCFGTARNCATGEACVDTTTPDKPRPAGKVCGLLSGGSCVSVAAAEALFGFKSSDVLPPCDKGCAPGAPCDAGWLRAGNRWAYQRVTATCPPAGGCSCGDGVCCPAELKSCVKDCAKAQCGDGICEKDLFGETTASCPADCAKACGDGWCDISESSATCATDCADRCPDAAVYSDKVRVCGDGVCDGGRTCDWIEPETCRTCPQDCGACEWAKANYAPVPLDLQKYFLDVWAASPTQAFVVGQSGTIVEYDGLGLRTMTSGTSESLSGVWGSSPTNVYAVGGGHILHYDDVAWKDATTPSSTANYVEVWGTSSSDIYVLGAKTDNPSGKKLIVLQHFDGASWQSIGPTNLPPSSYSLLNGWSSSSGEVYIATWTEGSIFHRTKAGVWQTIPPPAPTTELRRVGGAGNTLFAAGPTGVYKLEAGAWKSMNAPAGSYEDLWVSSTSDIYLLSRSGSETYVHHFDGKTWTTSAPALYKASLTDVSKTTSGLFAVGYPGRFMHFDGKAWTDLNPEATPLRLNSVWGASAKDLFAVGYRKGAGLILRGNGSVWTESTGLPSAKERHGVWGSSAADVYAVGHYKGLHFDGTTWKDINMGASGTIKGIWGTSATDVYAVGSAGSAGEVVRLTSSGWVKEAVPASTHPLYGVWGAAGGATYAVGWSGTIIQRSAGVWSSMTAPTPLPLNDVGGVPGQVFAVGHNRTILSLAGTTWTASKQVLKLVPFDKLGISFTSVWGVKTNDIYVAGRPGTLLHFDGSSWSYCRADLREPGLSQCPGLYGITGTPSGDLFAVGDNLLVLRRCPGGKPCP